MIGPAIADSARERMSKSQPIPVVQESQDPAITELGQASAGQVITEAQVVGIQEPMILKDGDIVALKSSGTTDGSRWLNGRTSDGTVGLAPQVDDYYTSALWQVFVPETGDVTSSAPSQNSINVTIYADQVWQNSVMGLSVGQQFNVIISGEWTYWANQIAPMPANGYDYICGSSTCCEPLPNDRKGALIGKIGNGGTFTASQSGNLELRMNDCDDSLGDNTGDISVTIQP